MKASRQNLLYIGGGIIAVCLIYLCFFRKTSEGFADDNKVDEGVVNIIVNAINDIANKKPEYAEMITKIYNDSKIKAIVSKVESKPVATASPTVDPTLSAASAATASAASAASPSVDPTLSAAATFSAAALPEPMPSAAAAAELPEPAILEPEAPSESPDSNYFDDDDDDSPY